MFDDANQLNLKKILGPKINDLRSYCTDSKHQLRELMEKALGMAGWCMCVWGLRSTTFFCQQQEQKTKVTLATHDFFIEFIKICENFSQRPRIDLNKRFLPRPNTTTA